MKKFYIVFILLSIIGLSSVLNAQQWITVLNSGTTSIDQLYGFSSPSGGCSQNENDYSNSSNFIALNPNDTIIGLMATSNCSGYTTALNTLNGTQIFENTQIESGTQGNFVEFDNNGNMFSLSSGVNSGSNTYLQKFNSTGQLLIKVTISDQPWQCEGLLKIDNTGNVYVYGKIRLGASSGDFQNKIYCYNNAGSLQWSSTITDYDWYTGLSGRFSLDNLGNIIFSGKKQTTQMNPNTYDIVVKKLNSQGVQLWQIYYDYNNLSDYIRSITTDAQGNIYFTDANGTGGSQVSLRLIKLDATTGAVIYQTQISSVAESYIFGNLKINTDGNLLVSSGNRLRCLNPANGNLLWSVPATNFQHFTTDVNGKIYITSDKLRIYSNTGSALDSISISIPSYAANLRIAAVNFNGSEVYIAGERAATGSNKIFIAKYSLSTNTSIITVDSPPAIQQNDTVEIAVNTSQLISGDGIISYQFKLAYDNTRLTYLNSTLVGTINSTGTLNANSATAGLLNIGGINQNNITGTGSLVKIKFIATTTLGNAQFTLSNFLYNTNPITDLVNDVIEIIDGIPPTGAITYSINPAICREGDNILITVTYNENMADAPIPQIGLSGVNILANTNLTKVSSTVYSYDYLVQHGSGDVIVHLFTGTDIAGNVVVETPTSGTYFTILSTKYGDIDTNTFVQAYDAALALQYSVGLDPLPTSDPLPWSNWRKIVANVDATGDITANDASLILQYSIELINTFPVEGTKSVLENPIADINISQVNNELILSSTGEFYGLNIFANNGSTVTLGTPIITDQTMLKAFNITGNTYNVGVCISTSPTDNTEIMRIPFTCTISETLTFNMLINKNAVTKTINVNAVGISENKMNSVNIYPNPANDKMIIEGLQNSIIEIINNQGQTVKTLNISNNKTTVDLTKISGGIYTMKIKSENVIIVKKLIKQ